MSIFNNENFRDEIMEKLTLPYLSLRGDSIISKKELAVDTLKLEDKLLLIPSCSIFSYSAILAGISEKQAEYISKNAPSDYKKELLNSIMQGYKIKEIFEIAKAMDDDLGRGTTQNQNRVKNVIQYIKDNKIAFYF